MSWRYLSSAIVVAFVAGCSFLVDTSDRAQCSITADCRANPALANRVCRAGFCELDPQPVSNDGGQGCTSTQICTQQQGGKSICKQAGGACVQLAIEGCTEITPGWDDPNALFIGTILPLTLVQPTKTAPPNPYSVRAMRAIQLAAKELRESLPAGYVIGGKARPLAVINCDSRGDPAIAKAMFTHLTDVAGAQAVIVGWDEDLNAIAFEAQQKQTTLICSDCLVPAPAGTVTWRILPNITADAALVRWRIGQLEADLEVKKPGDIKVAILSENLLVSRAFEKELASTLTFNGQSAASQLPLRFLSETAKDPRTNFPEYDVIAQKIADFGPDVVVVALPSDFPRSYLPLIEQKLQAAGKDKPHYVLTQLSYSAETFEDALPATPAGDELRARISGTHPYTTKELGDNMAAYELAYSLEWKESGADVPSAYEAFYVTALAIAAGGAGQNTIDSAKISTGFSRLTSGAVLDLKASFLKNALGMLAQGSSVNVRGIYTELDWNAARETPSDMGMFCFDRKPGGPLTVKNVDSVRWSAATGQVTVTGTYACP